MSHTLASASVAFLCALAGFAQDAPHPPGWVVIPINEYAALHTKAFPIEREPDPRTEAALTRVDYELKITGLIAAGRATLTVDVLKDGWVRVPLPKGLLVSEASQNGNSVSLTNNNGQLIALLSKKGRSVLTLDVSFVVTAAPGQEQLALPAGGAGVTRASISRATPQDADFRITGGFVEEKSDTHWLAYGRGNEPLVFTWRGRLVEQQKRVELPLRMRGSLVQLFGLGEDSTSLNAEVSIEVLQGVASQVKIIVPANVTINQVPGALIADWDVKAGELIVNFLEPVERTAKFAITGETRLPREGAIDVPVLTLLNSERDSGGVAVEVLGAGEIKDSKAQNLDSVDAPELGEMVAARQSPSLAAFRYKSGEHKLQIQVARYTQQAVLTANVEEARYRALASIDGKTLVQARYAVRNNQRTFIKITLPADAAVWSSSVAGRPARPGKGVDGSLLLPLAKSRAGEEAPIFTIEILYLTRGPAWTAKGHATLTLPVLDLPISRTGVTLYYPPQFRITPDAGAFRAQEYEKPSDDIWNVSEASAQEVNQPANKAALSLVNTYRNRSDTRRVSAALPVRVTFPAVGPSIYLVAELTGESKGAAIELGYQKDKKGGTK